MAFLFVLALLLIFWQAWRTEPLPPPGFSTANDPGEQLLPIAVPSWQSTPAVPADREERRRFLRERAVGAHAPENPFECELLLRVSAQHWYQRRLSAHRWRELTLGRSDDSVAGGNPSWSFPPAALLDDDDGDGDFLDPGELTREEPGAEVEVFCAALFQAAADP